MTYEVRLTILSDKMQRDGKKAKRLEGLKANSPAV